ncbi:MAG: hypothetical protein HY699_18655 [Deltaproteobacteria bacterium]|nr:hypothetical protein [Deltaproteobacteria bacterium]
MTVVAGLSLIGPATTGATVDAAGPVLWQFGRSEYRSAVRRGRFRPGIVHESPLINGRATVVFIHGGGGAPGQFAHLAGALRQRANLAAFLYDDTAHLAPASCCLRQGLLALPAPIILVAYSIGALLPAYAGASDPQGQLRGLTAVYVNPLIGGSCYADADRLLLLLGDVPGLRWLHRVKRVIQRALLPAVVQDLAPEGDFQQAIFGASSLASSFASGTVMLFTERPGEEPDIREDRVVKFFGRSRRELIERMGAVAPVSPAQRNGHAAPLADPELVLPLIATALEGVPPEG